MAQNLEAARQSFCFLQRALEVRKESEAIRGEVIMNALKTLQRTGQVFICGLLLMFAASAQEETPKQRERVARMETSTDNAGTGKTDPAAAVPTAADGMQKSDDSKDVAEIVDYYNNYMEEYRLGPEDVISVQVFGQCPDYCKESLTIPPTARISYPLIREGIFVAGKTTFEVEDEITKQLNEYIIDPKVTVTLTKVGSARYGVVGKVVTPGLRLMTRKVSIFEALAEAGGIAKEGDKKRAVILRPNAANKFEPIPVNLKEIEQGTAEMVFLKPGDQVIVGKEGFNIATFLETLTKVSILRVLVPF